MKLPKATKNIGGHNMNKFSETIQELKAKGYSAEKILNMLEAFAADYFNDRESEEDPFSERRVKEALTQLGMPVYMKGFEYWSYVLINFGREEKSMGEIYKAVATHFNVKVNTATRYLHEVLEELYTRGDTRKLERFFGLGSCFYQRDGSISNRNFLILMREYCKRA